MRPEDIALVRHSIDLFTTGHEWQSVEECFDPDGLFVSRFGGLEGRRYRGFEGMKEYMRDMEDAWSSFERELEDLVDAGDAVLAILRIRGVAKVTGIPVEARTGLAYWLRDGKIVRMVSYPSVEAAYEALSIEP